MIITRCDRCTYDTPRLIRLQAHPSGLVDLPHGTPQPPVDLCERCHGLYVRFLNPHLGPLPPDEDPAFPRRDHAEAQCP